MPDGHSTKPRLRPEPFAEGDLRPVIRVAAGELDRLATEAEIAMIDAGLPIYQRGNDLVRPMTREVPASRGRQTITAALAKIDVPALLDVYCQTAKWQKFDGRSQDYVPANPSSTIASIHLSRVGRWAVAPIAGVITTPTLRPDGSLLTEPGYDPASRLYHVADHSLRLHDSVFAPTRSAAEGALKALRGLLAEFPFVKMEQTDGASLSVAESVALSGMITPIVRGAMSVAPLHAFNAHAPGSGKSYLVDVISTIASGRPCPVITAAPEEAETEKRLAGLLLEGFPIVSLDNCNGELGGDLLCQAVERPLVRVRRLGGSDITEIESRATLFATGNNIRVRGDMVRRTVMAELDPEMERPELREFQADPVEAIQADRGRFVSACLVIVRAYIAAGLPDRRPPIASFEAWSDLVRSALVWLGCADPVLSMDAAREDDPELTELREMMGVWQASIGSDAMTCRQIVDEAASKAPKVTNDGDPDPFGPSEPRYPDLADALNRVAGYRGNVDTTRLGRWLLAREGRVADGLRFRRAGRTGGTVRWKLEILR